MQMTLMESTESSGGGPFFAGLSNVSRLMICFPRVQSFEHQRAQELIRQRAEKFRRAIPGLLGPRSETDFI